MRVVLIVVMLLVSVLPTSAAAQVTTAPIAAGRQAQDAYRVEYVGQDWDESPIQPGQTRSATIRLRNAGTATWSAYGANPVIFGTSHPRDRESAFSQGKWTSLNRTARMQPDTVRPGEVGSFTVPFTAPTNLAAGTYREYFDVVADGVTWMNDLGIYFPVTVAGNGAPASPAPAPPSIGWQRSDVVVVFLQGLHSTSASDGFGALKASLAAAGWSYGQFVDYSYRGGAWGPTYWQPAYYGCGDSLEGLSESKAQLALTLAGLRSRLPRSRFVLVGHSFGGLTALAHAAEAADPAVVGVVTVDSPLYGVGPGKSTLFDLWPCFSAQDRQADAITVAMNDLQAIYANRAGWDAFWRAAARRLGDGRVSVTTIGNDLDCSYWPSRAGCGIPFPFNLLTYSNDLWTQYLSGFEWRCSADAAIWNDTHSAILRAPSCLPTVTARIGQAAQPR